MIIKYNVDVRHIVKKKLKYLVAIACVHVLNSHSWLLAVTVEDMDDQARTLRMTPDSFKEENLRALSSCARPSNCFEYTIQKKKDDITFSWKKCLDNDDIRVIYAATKHCTILLFKF